MLVSSSVRPNLSADIELDTATKVSFTLKTNNCDESPYTPISCSSTAIESSAAQLFPRFLFHQRNATWCNTFPLSPILITSATEFAICSEGKEEQKIQKHRCYLGFSLVALTNILTELEGLGLYRCV